MKNTYTDNLRTAIEILNKLNDVSNLSSKKAMKLRKQFDEIFPIRIYVFDEKKKIEDAMNHLNELLEICEHFNLD